MDMRRRPETTRERAPSDIRPFESRTVVPYLTDIHPWCLCTWVPRPAGLGLPAVDWGRPTNPRQPWLTAGYAMKFANRYCPVRHPAG